MNRLQMAKKLHARVKRGWIQGSFSDDVGAVCLVGGVARLDKVSFDDIGPTLKAFSSTGRRLITKLASQPQAQRCARMGDAPPDSLMRFNDDHHTRKRDVLQLIAEVINQLQKEKTRRLVKQITRTALQQAAATKKEKVDAI
jgi:hypothetical protein